ncbi:DUF262 domain-containing protein [Salinicola halophyticus]|uniref:DUF262 domain-containing protein n=1 Tax=Salinicola halophyticus TaxID=1808881 RepID=UPI000DA18A40|nr:DUF262 domain-containing protein [Salinicola halophyticus]
MSKQIRPSVTNPTIATLYNEIDAGLLKLAPDFQRRFVWTQPHQEEFLDTILKGFPFPEIYVSSGSIDIEAMKTVRHVIDGQQRLTTIRNYISNFFQKPLSKIKAYSELSDDEKSDFLSYEIVVRDLGKIDDDTVKEVFRRINLTKFKLDSIEIHNAVYDGALISTAKEIIDHTELSIFGVFRENEFSRMADLHFILLVIATLETGGYFSQDAEVEPMIEKFNEEYKNGEAVKKSLVETLEYIKSLDLPKDSMWFRKSNFFTLVVEISLNGKYLKNNFRKRLDELEEKVMSNKNNSGNEFGEYYSYMYQGTNNRKARVTRARLFRKMCTDLDA